MITAYLAERLALNATVVTLRFRPTAPLSFLAGQYIQLVAPHQAADNRGLTRWFTISSRPGTPLVDITMRVPPSKPSSFKRTLAVLPLDSPVQLGEVLGDFVVPKDATIPLVFVADGIGVAPFISMVRDLAHTQDTREITLFHRIRQADDALFQDEFRAYGVHYYPRLATTPLTGAQISAAAPPQALYYLAGSEPMCLRTQYELQTAGVAGWRIALDYFEGYDEAVI